MTRPDMSIKVERQLHDMRILGRIVGVRSTEQFVRHLLTPTSNHSESQDLEKIKEAVFRMRDSFFQSLHYIFP